MAQVRYLTISRVAIELVSSLSPEENKLFNTILFSCLKQLENGQEPEVQKTESPVMDFVLREAVQELESGYKTYLQRITAAKKKKGSENHRSISDISPINQRSTIEEKREDEKREEKNYGSPTFQGISEAQRAEIETRLQNMGIEHADTGFWNTCFVHGFDSVDAALSKAESVGNANLKFITSMIANGLNY